MGIHHWTGYVSYEIQCCEAMKTLLDLFCFTCHTPDDVGGCHRCEIGRANLMMLKYLKDSLKPNKDLKTLVDAIEKEEPFYCFLRLRSHFRPKRASPEYMKKIQKKNHKGWVKSGLISHWAKNNQECDRVMELLERLKEAKSKY